MQLKRVLHRSSCLPRPAGEEQRVGCPALIRRRRTKQERTALKVLLYLPAIRLWRTREVVRHRLIGRVLVCMRLVEDPLRLASLDTSPASAGEANPSHNLWPLASGLWPLAYCLLPIAHTPQKQSPPGRTRGDFMVWLIIARSDRADHSSRIAAISGGDDQRPGHPCRALRERRVRGRR